MNDLKRLLTEEELHNLKNTAIRLEKYLLEHVKPLESTISGEIRRYISIHRKLQVMEKETSCLIECIKLCLGQK